MTIQPISSLPSPALASEMRPMVETFMIDSYNNPSQDGFLKWLMKKPWSEEQAPDGKLVLSDEQMAAFLTDYLNERVGVEVSKRIAGHGSS